MKELVNCKDIFKSGYFNSYSECYLALAMSKELGRRGKVLDMSSMRIDADVLPEGLKMYLRNLISEGCVKIDDRTCDIGPDPEQFSCDVSAFSALENILYRTDRDEYYWDSKYAYEAYGDSKLMMLKKLGALTMHMVAKFLLDLFEGKADRQVLRLRFDDKQTKSPFVYINLTSCTLTLDWFKKHVKIDVEVKDVKVDIEYSIFCSNGRMAGRYKMYSTSEKLELLEKYGMTEGMILSLYRRSGMCVNNPYGSIDSVVLVRVDEIIKEQGKSGTSSQPSIILTEIPLVKTREEVREEYYEIPEENRLIFSDLLDKKLVTTTTTLSLCDTGIENHGYMESEFLSRLEKSGVVSKLITVDGKSARVEMNEIDAIYWLLRQYEVEFDIYMFKEAYNNGEPLMWDLYN